MEKALDCKIIVNKFDEEGNIIGFSVLSSEDAINLTADNKNITERDILLYDLGNATGLERQRKVLELIEKEKLTESYADDDNDGEVLDKKRIENWRVSGRSTIIVKQGDDKPFDSEAWGENIKKTYRDRIGASMSNITVKEMEEIVDNTYNKIKKFNDTRADLGTDAHKIAEIIFSNPNFVNINQVIDEINRLLKSGTIEFKSDLYKSNEKAIRAQTADFFFKLRSQLREKHGKCEFLTERSFRVDNLKTEGTYNGLSDYLCGTIDLIVVDEEGEVHLYDFKSSTHDFDHWPEFKKNTTSAQLYTYKMMLEAKGVRPVKTLNTVDLTFDIETDTYDPVTKSYSYKFVGVRDYNPNKVPIHKLDIKDEYRSIIRHWFQDYEYIPPLRSEYLETDKIINEALTVSETDPDLEDIAAPYFTKNKKGELVPNKELLAEFDYYEYPKEHPMYKKGYVCSYKIWGDTVRTLCKKDEFKSKFTASLKRLTSDSVTNAADLAHSFAREYKDAKGDPTKINYGNILGSSSERQIWLKNEVSHYLENSDFELNTEDVYLDQGYLLWKHKTLGFVECVVISGESLMKTKRLAKGTTILGKIREDGHVDKKEIMTASNGNLALMRFMTFVANSPGTKEWCSKFIDDKGEEQPCKIASIRVINPFGNGAKEIRPNLSFVTNNYEVLCNNSKELLKENKEFKRIDTNLFYNDAQSLALQAVSQCEDLIPIYNDFDTTKFSFDYRKVDDVLDFIDECLGKLVKQQNKSQYQLLENFDPSDPTWRAIFYLINIQNALHGHTYIAELGSGKWFNEGFSPTGLMISAPGMSTSTTMRTFDEVNKAYVDSVIQAVNKYGKSGKEAVIDMYAQHGMDKLLGGSGNSSHYLSMFETEGDALTMDFRLKDPINARDLSTSQREVIKEFMVLNYRLTLLSQRSKKGLEEITDEQKNEIYKDPRWREVPLMDAAFSRQLHNHHKSSNNWFETVKFAVKNKWREMGNLYQDVMVDDLSEFDKDVNKYLKGAYVLDRRCTWNMFNYTRVAGKRYNLLHKFGPERFETNIEIVMDNMLVAFFKEYYSKQYASQLSALRLELAYAKRAGQDVTEVIDVFDLAVKTKFYGDSPIPPDLQKYFRPLARLKGIFSMLQIGGKAVSMLKEIVYGTFIGFSNVVGQSLPGVNAETYWKAFKYVTTEAFKSSKGVSKLNHLQMQYHIANYGLSQVANQRRYNSLGWRNWSTDTLFLTATSPDFFHRMIILVSKMMADGTWDAYDFDEDAVNGFGRLTYDVMKDPRFAKFTSKDPRKYDDPEYWQQRAMFEQYIQEFNKSGITDPNGNKLSMEPDENGNYYLPRPYVQREVDTFKNYADMLYGHYDDESKALINDTFLGAFWLQYKTFVTAKVERYGMKPGIYNTHLLKQQYVTIDDKGTKEALYLKTIKTVNEQGVEEFHRSVVRESELTDYEKNLRQYGTEGHPETGESVTAFIQWEGIPMEGIMHSIGSFSRTLMGIIKGDEKALSEFKLIWDDPTKRGNFIVALNDLILMGLLGMIGSTLFGMYNDLDFTEAWNNESAVRQLVRAGNWAENGLYDIFVGAMQDGPITNTISSMFQAPPIMTSIERAWKDSVNLLTGDSSAFEFLTNEVGALRIFDGMAQAAAAE